MPFFDKYPYTNFHNVNLDWVLERVKEWGQMVEDNNTRFENLLQANEDFKSYVNNYLQNLDVQEEINIKLDSMLESGVLIQYMQPYMSTGVTTWLNENITEPEGVIIDRSLTVEDACADAKATGKALSIPKASILFGYFDIDTTNRTISNTNRATLIDAKNRAYKFIEPTTIQLPTQSNLANFVYLLLYKISNNTLFIFVPNSSWSEYNTLNNEINNNPRDYLYLFSFYCYSDGRATYLDTDSSYRYRVNGIYYNNDKTNFYIFKNRNRITPYAFFINFLSISSFKVISFSMPNDNGIGFHNLPNNYIVDWSNIENPAYVKLITLNNSTNRIEVVKDFDDNMLLTHSYIGVVTNGSISDVILTNGNALIGSGFSIESIYGIPSNIYRNIFNRFDDLYKLPKKVGVIGDSLSVGYMRNNNRLLPYSWVKHIQYDSGNQWLNFGASGYTTLLWCSSPTYGKIQMETSGNKCQVYIIGLGVNDCAGTNPVPLGSQYDIVNNPDRVATTFYGGYARIIQLIKRLNPNAIVICLTIPKLGDNFNSYNNAIRYIANTYYSTDNKVILMDIANNNMELFNDSSSKLKIDSQKTNAGGHFTAYGYRMIAGFMKYKLNELIYNNTVFENIPFIDYDNTEPVGDV